MLRFTPGTITFLWLASLTFGQVAATTQPAQPAVTDGGITVYFSPRGGATQAIVTEIAQAKDTIQVLAYQFTPTEIAKALTDAHKRGVNVVVVLDPGQEAERYHVARFLYNAGIPAYLDHKHILAHNKIMIIDGKTVITGSFNFTKGSEQSNADNLLVIKDHPDLTAAYVENFTRHLQHATKDEGTKDAGGKPEDKTQDQPPKAPPTPPKRVPSPKSSGITAT